MWRSPWQAGTTQSQAKYKEGLLMKKIPVSQDRVRAAMKNFADCKLDIRITVELNGMTDIFICKNGKWELHYEEIKVD
jgi:hypothetical protein